MTVFIYVNNQFKLNELQTRYGSLISSAVNKTIGPIERKSLVEVISWFDETRFSKEEFLTEDMSVKQGTKVIFSTTNSGGLSAEVISPGPWSLAACYTLGHTTNPIASEIMFDIILGKKAICMECKKQIWENALYLAKGGGLPRSRLESSIHYRDMNDWQRPGAPNYPEPEGSLFELTYNMFSLKREIPSLKDQPISIKLLSEVKRENRRRVDRAIAKKVTSTINRCKSSECEIQFEVELDHLPDGDIPRSIRRFPVEFMDLQSPYEYYNEPTKLAVENDYDGYESSVEPVKIDEIYCPIKIPTLDPVEDELTCLELPTDDVDNIEGKMALISNFVDERSKKDQYYKGIFVTGDQEKLDVHGPPSNKCEKLLDSEWGKAYLRWQQVPTREPQEFNSTP